MSISIDQWRICIGSFNGGRSGTSSTLSQARSERKQIHGIGDCTGTAMVLLALMLSPILLVSCWSHLPMYRSSWSQSGKVSQYQFCTTGSGQPCLTIIPDIERLDMASHVQKTTKPRISRKKINQQVRAIVGNRSNKGIKLAHWNAGSAYLHNKVDDLVEVVADLHPHVLGVSEANFKREHSLDEVQIQDYDLVLSKTVENDQLRTSRVVCYKHQSLVGRVRNDLMDDNFSSIWLELGLPRKRKFLVCQLYREWQYLDQADHSSRSVPEQLLRWSVFLDQWVRALESGKEVIVMGDFNLNFFKFTNAGQLQPLINQLMEQVYPHGVQQCVQGPTHSWPGQSDSCIDLIFTNKPEKVGHAQTQTRGSSDHRLILISKHSKNAGDGIRYVRKRSYKTFDESEFREAVKKIRWYEIYSCQDVDLAVDALTTKLTEILDVMAPVKTFQVRKKYAAWVSSDTKEKMKARDAAQVRAATTQLKEDWELYRRLRNDLVVVKRKEKLAWQQQKLEDCEESGDHGKLWKNVLGWLNWSSSISPTKLSKDGALVTSPSKMAEIQNEYYINKVRTIRQSMPPQRRHPLHTLRQSMQDRARPFSLDPVSPTKLIRS